MTLEDIKNEFLEIGEDAINGIGLEDIEHRLSIANTKLEYMAEHGLVSRAQYVPCVKAFDAIRAKIREGMNPQELFSKLRELSR